MLDEFDGLFAQIDKLIFYAFHGEMFLARFFFIHHELDGEFLVLLWIIIGEEG